MLEGRFPVNVPHQIRPTEAELKEMGPEFNELWKTYFKDKPDKPVMFGSIVAGGESAIDSVLSSSADSSNDSLRGPHFASSREVHHHVSLVDLCVEKKLTVCLQVPVPRQCPPSVA